MTALFPGGTPHLPATAWQTLALVAVLAGTAVVAARLAGATTGGAMAGVGLTGYLFDAHLYIPVAVLTAEVLALARPARGPLRRPRNRARAGASARDIGLIAVGFALYELGRIATQGDAATAVRNGERVWGVERAIGLPSEARVQALVLRSDLAVRVFNTVYSFLFLSTVVGVLVWLSFRDPPTYRAVRNAAGISAAAALAIFAAFPVAPPRLTAASGLVDSHARVGLHHGFVNQYAAVPSLHVGWMALVGWGIARVVGGWRGRLLGALPATAMWATVVVTGNHYWLDGLVGTVLCLGPLALMDPAGAPRSLARRWAERGARATSAQLVPSRAPQRLAVVAAPVSRTRLAPPPESATAPAGAEVGRRWPPGRTETSEAARIDDAA
jgi:PAP2 superfamily